jgi:hypothetical protein
MLLNYMTKITPLLIVCLITQGCMAIGVGKIRTQTIQNPVILDTASVDSLCPCNLKHKTYTAAWLESHWGKPNSIGYTGKDSRDEVWTYKFHHAWVGVGAIVVIVPIPLLLPVQREQAIFTIRDGQVVSVKKSQKEYHGGIAGYLVTPAFADWVAFWI